MTCRNSKLFSILLFAAGMFFLNAPPVQACTPVVYLLRHAEDQDTPKQLTERGMKHADLYPEMVKGLEGRAGLCKVQQVFAMWDRNKGDGVGPRGTTNPYFTGLPLAQDVTNPTIPAPLPCPQPPTPPPPGGYTPEMCFQDAGYPAPGTHKYYLCEHIIEDPNDPNTCENNAGIDPNKPDAPHRNFLVAYSGDTNSHLNSYLLAYLQANPTSSVAIFYTSQGMPDVSTALGVNPVDVGDTALNWPGTLRSSVNIFTLSADKSKFVNTDYYKYKKGEPRTALTPTQCFADTDRGTTRYGCQNTGSLDDSLGGPHPPPAVPVPLPISAVFCTDVAKMDRSNVYYGYCPGASASASSLASPHDLDANTISDIVWRDTSGDIAIWLMNAAGVASSAGLGNLPTTWSIVGQRDFDGNGTADLLWRDSSGNTAIWFMNGTAVASTASVGNIAPNFTVVATGDFNGDGLGDILWQDASGNLAMWLMNGATVSASGSIGNVPANWSLAGTGDFDGDGKTDLLWRDNAGNTAIWLMNGTTIASTGGLGNIPTAWTVVGIGDFDGDGKSDIVWRDGTGNTAIWLMNGASVSSAAGLGTIPVTFSIAQTGDFNGDGKSDLLWRDTSGNTAVWFMNGTAVASTMALGNVPTNWTVQSVNAD